MQAIGMEHVGQVIEDVESQVDIYLIERLRIFAQLTYLLLFRRRFLSFGEGIIQVLRQLALGAFFQKPVDLLLHFLEVLVLRLFFFEFGLRGRVSSRLVHFGLALEAGGGVRFHGGTQTLLGCAAHGCVEGAGADGIPLVRRWWWFLLYYKFRLTKNRKPIFLRKTKYKLKRLTETFLKS